ncbi:MAG: (Fe-S)-binding protein [Archaeoglobi archaeon]|nr:(Fe-S)-binding protein [Candidatus Mnemosynella sp.]
MGERTLYYAGCMASYRVPSIAKATAKVLEAGGIDFEVLGEGERCCGSVLLRTGQRDAFEKVARENAEILQKYDRIITTCAGCYRTFKFDYPEFFDINAEILHTTEIVAELLREGRLKVSPMKTKIIYHDPCHLGRHSGVYEPPREILSMIPGAELVEFERSREESLCCGAGAGVRSAFPELSRRIASQKVREAENKGADLIVSACPFCEYNLRDASERVRVADILELISELVEVER